MKKTSIILLCILLIGTSWLPTISSDEPIDDTLVACWHFDEGSGSIAYDSSGTGNDGTVYGASWTTGVSGAALYYDGIDDYVLVPDSDSISIGNQDLTLSVWIKPFSLEEAFAILSKTHDGHNKEFLLWYRDDSEPNRQIEYKIENWYDDLDYVATTDTTINLNQWQHVVVTFKADDFTTKIYHNGIQQTTSGNIGELPQMLDDDLTIGIYNDGNIMGEPFDGLIDEISLYNRVLTANEIQALYEQYANQPPVADFTYTPVNPKIGGILEFIDVSTDLDGTIVSWWWDFGDGYFSNLQNPIHIYYLSGTYDVTLTVTDNDGNKNTIAVAIDVINPSQEITNLIGAIDAMDLHQGLENSLTQKLMNVIQSIGNEWYNDAINQLNAFINQVEAQRGNKLTDAQANFLVVEAQAIINSI